MHNRVTNQSCTIQLLSIVAQQNCITKLHNKIAQQSCTIKLHDIVEQQNCTTKGHNQAAQKPAQQICAPKMHNKAAMSHYYPRCCTGWQLSFDQLIIIAS